MRKIPTTMATQHPDSASKYVPVTEEPDEAVFSFKNLGCEEYLVDYMSKLTPYHEVAWIINKLTQETNLVLGRDVFITPRMVSGFREEPFRQLMTILSIMEGINNSLKSYGDQGILEIVYGMIKAYEAPTKCKERVNDIFALVKKELNLQTEGELRIIPLYEGVPEQLSVKEMVPEFISQVDVKDYARVFIGKSETALLYGHPASVLSSKIAIADCYQVQEELGVEIFPIFGGGALPFRGHITLETIDRILEEYRGAKTYTVQSGMRYDHGPEKTVKLIDKIKAASDKKPLQFDDDERKLIIQLITIFAKNYLLELHEIAETVSKIAAFIPNQRDRVLSSEQVAYYRELKNVVPLANFCQDTETKEALLNLDPTKLQKLPRVIKFTAALYTCGMPPEFIGTGNALKEIKEKIGQESLEKFLQEIYPTFVSDLKSASKFLNPNPNENLLITNKISQSIENLKPYIQFEQPDSGYTILNQVATTYIKNLLEGKKPDIWKLAIQIYPNEVAEYLNGSAQENLSKLILDMGKLRGSLG